MNKYTLKDGREIEAIPIGKSSVKIGEVNAKGTLTVCDRAPNEVQSSRSARVICKCICGNYTVLSINSFRQGTTFSCGCLAKEIQRENGKKVGKISHYKDYSLTDSNIFYNFLEPIDRYDDHGCQYWKTECKLCGKIYETIPVYLVNTNRPKGLNPCECYRNTSKGMLIIEKILTDNNISFEKEKKFDTCLSPKGNHMKFDFYIDNKYLIEYDGEQHFKPEQFNQNVNGDEKLKKQQEYDQIKNQWCKNNNIPLIRIPYTHFKNIELKDLLLETSKFILR